MSDDIDWSKIEGISSDNEDESESDESSGSRPARSHKSRGLGRGLDALFGDDEETSDSGSPQSGGSAQGSSDAAEDKPASAQDSARRVVGIDQLTPNPDQPRKKFNDKSVEELAESIARHGVLQPLLVRPRYDGEDGYEIIAGERRWRACQLARVHDVPVIVHDLGDEQTLELALIENLQREDLNPIDEALGYQHLMDKFGKSQGQLAESLGKSRSHIANMVRLAQLPDQVQAMLRDGSLSAGHARTLINASDPEEMARQIVSDNLSVRQAEALATQSGASKKRKSAARGASGNKQTSQSGKSGSRKDVDTLALEEEISNILGMQVEINMYGKGGSLKVEFEDLDVLDDLLHRLTHGARSSNIGS